MSLSRTPVSKTPKQVFFNPIKYILTSFTHSIYCFYNILFSFNVNIYFDSPSLIDLNVSYNKIDSSLSILQGYRSTRRAMLTQGVHTSQMLSLEKVSLAGNLLTESSARILADIMQLRFVEDDGEYLSEGASIAYMEAL